MSRVLLAAVGSLGDLHPMLAVGRALQSVGLQAVIATSPDYAPQVAQAGLAHAPVRPAFDQMGDRARLARRLFHPLHGPRRLLTEVVLPWLPQAHQDIAAAAHDCDLLVSHPLSFAVPMVAGQQGKPWLSTVLAPASFLSRHDPPRLAGVNLLQRARERGPLAQRMAWALMRRTLLWWERPLHRYRREHDLPALHEPMLMVGQFSPQGTLALFDALLAAPQPDWPVHTRLCGAPLHDGGEVQRPLPPAVQRFLEEGEAPLVFALGSSAVWFAQRYWSQVIAAVQQLGRRALLLTGGQPLPALPAGVMAVDYLPYSQVFARAAVVVHQCGIGTLSQALRAGRPQLLTPVAFDQPDNAQRAARLGVGPVLPFAQVNASRLVPVLDALLRDADAARAAAAVAKGLAGHCGARQAAQAIVSMLHRA